jgi:rubrerythrin
MTDVSIQTQPPTQTRTTSQLPFVFQYTVEAYKTFQKLAENLPNPMAAALFASFATDERVHRDLLEVKYVASSDVQVRLTLGNDLRFQDILEGDLSYREITEMLIVRERTMATRLREYSRSHAAEGQNLYAYIAASKRAHVAMLERELELINLYPDWFRREDAAYIIIHGIAE